MRCRLWILGLSTTAQLLAGGRFDIVHAHDWSVRSVFGPARRAGVPVVLTQHDYSHVCATKRFIRGDDVCPGPAPIACLRSRLAARASGRPGRRSGERFRSRSRTRHVNTFVPVSSIVAINTRCRGGVLMWSSPAHSRRPSVGPPHPNPDGPIVFVGDLSHDKGVEVLLEAHRRLGRPRQLVLAGRVHDDLPLDISGRWSSADCSITLPSSTSCRRPLSWRCRRSCPTAVRP